MISNEFTVRDDPFDVPNSEDVARCPHCDRPFASAHQRDLHLGEVHEDRLTDGERAAFDAGIEEEHDRLWMYHFKAVIMLLVIYMATGLLYLIVLSG